MTNMVGGYVMVPIEAATSTQIAQIFSPGVGKPVPAGTFNKMKNAFKTGKFILVSVKVSGQTAESKIWVQPISESPTTLTFSSITFINDATLTVLGMYQLNDDDTISCVIE